MKQHLNPVLLILPLFILSVSSLPAQESGEKPIPVIYDTDIGDDIDDLWGLVFALKSPELDVRLVTTSRRPTKLRAKVVAKTLTMLDRHDVPVAAGKERGNPTVRYHTWAQQFDLSEFQGEFSTNGVEKIIETVEADDSERLKIITVGTMTNVAEALKRKPELARSVEFVAMSGHLETDEEEAEPETNVKLDVNAARKGYAANWKRMTIAPFNITKNLHLDGPLYKHVYDSDKPAARAIVQAYEIFAPNAGWVNYDVSERSSTLHDTVAVYLAFSDRYVSTKTLPLRVTDRGITRVDRVGGHPVQVALSWKDMASFKKLLVRRITGSLPSR